MKKKKEVEMVYLSKKKKMLWGLKKFYLLLRPTPNAYIKFHKIDPAKLCRPFSLHIIMV